MYSSETGWRDYTPQQIEKMTIWYLILVSVGVALIFLFFFSRKDKYDV